MTKKETNEAEKDKNAKPAEKKDDKEEPKGLPLTESDIVMFKRYGKGPYNDQLKKVEDELKEFNQKISALCGVKETDTGLSLPAQWNLKQD